MLSNERVSVKVHETYGAAKRTALYDRPWTIKQIFRPDWWPEGLLNLVCFLGPVQFRETGIEPAYVPPTKSTPIYTHSRARQPAVRRMALLSPHNMR